MCENLQVVTCVEFAHSHGKFYSRREGQHVARAVGDGVELADDDVFVAGDDPDASHQYKTDNWNDHGHGRGLEVFLRFEGADHTEAPLTSDHAGQELGGEQEACQTCRITIRNYYK